MLIVIVRNSPVSVLHARRKIICSVCTVNKDQPLMIEEGREWDAHQKTRIHKRLVGKASRDLVDKEHRAVRKQSDNSEAEDNVDDMLLFS
jgi:tRNA dimethylallyltransferase